MTTVAAILKAGYREGNILAIGEELSAKEVAEALPLLQGIILSSLGADLGYIMEDWNISDASYIKPNGVPIPTVTGFTVRPNSRLICNLAGEIVLALDPQPQDGQRFGVVDAGGTFNIARLTLNPNGRKIEGSTANLEITTQNYAKQWFYRSDTGNWTPIDALTEADEMPFPSDFDDYFSILLALRVNPRYGMAMKDDTKDRFAQQQREFVNRYTQSRLRSIPAPADNNPARGN